MLFILARNDHPCGLLFVINKSISTEIGTKIIIRIEKVDGMNPILFFFILTIVVNSHQTREQNLLRTYSFLSFYRSIA